MLGEWSSFLLGDAAVEELLFLGQGVGLGVNRLELGYLVTLPLIYRPTKVHT